MRQCANCILLTLCLILLCSAAPAFAASQPQIGSIQYYLQSLGLYQPSAGDLVDYQLSYAWNFVDWSLQGRTTFNRDSQDRPTTTLEEGREGESWVNVSLTTTSYDATGSIETLNQNWDGDSWVNDTRSLFENDDQQRPEVITSQTWNGSGWDNQSRSRISYETGMMIAVSFTDLWEEGAWVENGKTVYTYSDGHTAMLEVYVKQGLELAPLSRTTFTYNGGVLEQSLTELWIAIGPNPETWVASSRITYTYDGNLQTQALVETYNAVFPPLGWVMSSRTTMEYDAQDRLSVTVNEQYIPSTALDWQNSGRTEYYYTPAAVRQIDGLALPDRISLEQNYPNPFNPATEIRFALTHSSQVTLDIYDVMGRKVRTLIDQTMPVGTHEVDFDGADLASGVYFYRLQADDLVQTKKMLLLK